MPLCVSLFAQKLSVDITGIRNNKGVINLAFFTCEKSFRKEDPDFYRIVSKGRLSGGRISVVFDDIPPGRYGIALLDDENEDGKMRYNILGIPREGFGFSNYYHTGLSKPRLNDFIFDFYDDKVIKIRVRYM